MGVLTGRPINLRRLLLFALVLSLVGGPGISESYQRRYTNVDTETETSPETTRECGNKGCLYLKMSRTLDMLQDCALPAEDMQCMVEKRHPFNVRYYSSCSPGNYLLKERSDSKVVYDSGKSLGHSPAAQALLRKGEVEVRFCKGEECNRNIPPPITTPQKDASMVSPGGVLVVTLGTLMILYAWRVL